MVVKLGCSTSWSGLVLRRLGRISGGRPGVRFRSIEVCAQPDATGLSYVSEDNRNPPEPSPSALFARIFGAGFSAPGDGPQLDPRIVLRRSVLDAVMEDSRSVQGRVSASDRVRLDQHLSAIRDLELRLARMQENPPNLAACAKPGEPPGTKEFAWS